jgi:hypothetical protein
MHPLAEAVAAAVDFPVVAAVVAEDFLAEAVA